VQEHLRKLLFPIDSTGDLDPATRTAVRVIQAARSLEPTGELTWETELAIEASAASYVPGQQADTPCHVSPPRADQPVKGLYLEDEVRGAVALTFDDGPSVLYTSALVRMLKLAGVTATFYVQGSVARQYPHIVREIVVDHLIGNHFCHHTMATSLSDEEIAEEILSAAEIITRAAGPIARKLCRPPYGIPFWTTREPYGSLWRRFGEVISSTRHDLIMWQICAYDWKYPGSPESLVIRFRAELARTRGGVILMHDIHEQTLFAMPGILDVLRQQGIAIVTDTYLLDRKYEQLGGLR
jgi:peptidoglycan/xylan/chitin deacetylase (PgdA/CDA1 family)